MDDISIGDKLISKDKLRRIVIDWDEDYESPRDSYDHLGKFWPLELHVNKNYLPAEYKFDFPEEVWGMVETMPDFLQHLVKHELNNGDLVFPVWVHDHSGTAFNICNPYDENWKIDLRDKHNLAKWDEGWVGVCIAEKKDIQNDFEVKEITSGIKDKVFKILTSELEIYAQSYNGEVWKFREECRKVIIDHKGNKDYTEWDLFDEGAHCSGMFGDINNIKNALRDFGEIDLNDMTIEE